MLGGKQGRADMPGRVQAFADYGVKLRNDQSCWSGRTTANGEVVASLWKDRFNYKTKPASYSTFDDPNFEEWRDRQGVPWLIEDLLHARDNWGGRFRVVIVSAVRTTVEPRRTIRHECYSRPNMKMQLVDLNEHTGEFSAYVVGTE
jgi:hypothetical protein